MLVNFSFHFCHLNWFDVAPKLLYFVGLIIALEICFNVIISCTWNIHRVITWVLNQNIPLIEKKKFNYLIKFISKMIFLSPHKTRVIKRIYIFLFKFKFKLQLLIMISFFFNLKFYLSIAILAKKWNLNYSLRFYF